MGDKQAMDAGNENAVVRAVVGAHAVSRSAVTLPTLTVFAFVLPCVSSPNAGRLPADVKASMPSAVPTTEGMTGDVKWIRCEMIVAVAC
ncbi:hypothetical protein SprV_0702304500 [Sparganum proliferum]